MTLSRIAGVAAAALLVVTPSAFAQTPAQPQEKTTTTAATQTFAGCLMTEPDYRKAHNLGSGAIGGMGLGDEFVLVDVKTSAAKGATDTTMKSDTSAMNASASSTSSMKCADRGVAYRLTGTQEEKLKGLAGHQLEVQGRFKHADDVNPNAAQPADKLPAEVEIVSFRESPAPAATAEPVPQSTAPVTQPAPRVSNPTPAPTATTPATTPNELPHSASSIGLVALVGMLALASGVVVIAMRRRAL